MTGSVGFPVVGAFRMRACGVQLIRDAMEANLHEVVGYQVIRFCGGGRGSVL